MHRGASERENQSDDSTALYKIHRINTGEAEGETKGGRPLQNFIKMHTGQGERERARKYMNDLGKVLSPRAEMDLVRHCPHQCVKPAHRTKDDQHISHAEDHTQMSVVSLG